MDFFEEAYHGHPPWDIGRPQKEFVNLEESGAILGDVLDVGCGTGENALYLAGRGHGVWGVDSAPTAIGIAREKARKRDLSATFLVTDALNLDRIGRTFDTVIDSGLFHALTDPERPCFVRNLTSVLRQGGTYYMLAFSDREPAGYGPRRISKREIEGTFSDGWRIAFIRPAIFENRMKPEGAKAWLSAIVRE